MAKPKPNAIVKVLEARKAAAAEAYARASWDLMCAEADAPERIRRAGQLARNEIVPEPTDPVARAIVAAGRKRRGL